MKVNMDELSTETFTSTNNCVISNWPPLTPDWLQGSQQVSTSISYVYPQEIKVKVAQNGYVVEFKSQFYIAKDEQELCKLIKSFKEVK
jgi:hypothetical protein